MFRLGYGNGVITLLPRIARGAQVFAEIEMGPSLLPRAIQAANGMPTEASALLRASAASFSAKSRSEQGFLHREWQESYLSALVRDFNTQINHPAPTTVVLGTAPLVHTTLLASRNGALIFFDVREAAIVATLSQRLRRIVEHVYSPHSPVAMPPVMQPEQKLYQATGLVAMTVLGGMLDAYDGQTDLRQPSLRAAGFLADRTEDGVRSLDVLRSTWESGHLQTQDEFFPAWNPTTPAFILAHEFGHLYTGGPIHEGVLQTSFLDDQYTWGIFGDCRKSRAHFALRVAEDLERYDPISAQQSRQGVESLDSDPALSAETLTDVIAMVAATSLLTNGDEIALNLASPPDYPPADLLMWQSTAVAVALMQAARDMGTSIATNRTAGMWTDPHKALGTYLLRAWTSVLASIVVEQQESTIEDRMTAGRRLILAGIQQLTELRAGIEAALIGKPPPDQTPPTNDVLKGAAILGIRVGNQKKNTHLRHAELNKPVDTLDSIRSAYRDSIKRLFDLSTHLLDARYRELPWLPGGADEELRRKLWESI